MFEKILVANRGEIALRVIRATRELGIRSVAVYSEADALSRPVKLADEAVCIGPAMSAKSYLSIEKIIEAARKTGADAVHPGYGYLAENADFADACGEIGLAFIGPAPDNLRLAGDKIAARRVMEGAGVPVIPAGRGAISTAGEARRVALDVGYPVMIKAAGGGGGRGIRICPDEETLDEEFPVARAEASASFGNGQLYVEKYIVRPRHIEFQVLADGHGNVTHLGERECSIQRRFQKLVEESPSPRLTPLLRARMGAAAVAAARAVDYHNAGTVEFLVDEGGDFYFMEMNARIQVEHPVTEMVTGIDLVKEQIRLAAGQELGYGFDDLSPRGWAMECRINAEDPTRGFRPSPGMVEEYSAPGGYGVRVDSHLYQGCELPIYYDSLIAKLVTFDATREGAIAIMRRALGEFSVAPLKTTIPLLQQIMNDEEFIRGEVDTSFISRLIPDDDDDDADDDDFD